MGRVLGWELEFVGRYGLQAHRHPALFDLVSEGRNRPTAACRRTIPLAETRAALVSLVDYRGAGMTTTAVEREIGTPSACAAGSASATRRGALFFVSHRVKRLSRRNRQYSKLTEVSGAVAS
ncbi:hypothetical protein Pla108_34070 [Botrimarina colliarenosi]|uniref:Uncharacterized protein n=1 Tax=Botrimarina colliarenosi TaxID=2528001 RepID=A0A5C6AAB4_9BACT|nr:hypothetical protein Pla108_34070 [Botrimarina colliarenosi]